MPDVLVGYYTEEGARFRVFVDVRLEAKLSEHEWQTVEHEPAPNPCWEWAVSAVVDEHRRGRWGDYRGGQCVEDVAKVTGFAPGWNAERAAELVALWTEWHLNMMTAGCAHQTPVYAPDRYGRSVPSLDLTPACPLTGYKYGHAWLTRVIPPEVLDRMRTFAVARPAEVR